MAGAMAGATARITASATATRLRFQKLCNVAKPVSDTRSVDALERAADVQPPFVLQRLHAAPADGGVRALIDPSPGDRGHLRQIDKVANGAHDAVFSTKTPRLRWRSMYSGLAHEHGANFPSTKRTPSPGVVEPQTSHR